MLSPFSSRHFPPVALIALCALLVGCGGEHDAAPAQDEAASPPLELTPTLALDSVEHGEARDPRQLNELERLWSAQRYAEVLPLLIEYRASVPYGKNEVVDYMIGTTACRLPGQEGLGHRMLAWILARYSLNEESRSMVQAEMDRCPPAARLIPVSLSLVGVGPASTSGTRGKTFYMLNRGGDVPLANEPVIIHRSLPAEELEARLFTAERSAAAAAHLARLAGDGYRGIAEGAFVLASRTHSADQMRAIARGLTLYLDFFTKEYGIPAPPHLISVYLASDAAEMRQIAERVHGIGITSMSIGYSFRDDLSMVGIIPGMVYGTLAHELFHLMVRRNFGDVPPWLDEGLAALYEVSRVESGGRVRGIPNWRGPVLRELWYQRPSVEDLVRADWRAFEASEYGGEPVRQAANHATARYLVLLLQERGMLRDVYRAFHARDAVAGVSDVTADAVSTFEQAVGRSVGEMDHEFADWFQSLSHD